MGMDELQIFHSYTYLAATEVLRQQVELFNEATRGAIILRAADNLGSYTEEAYYALIADLIRRRNVFSNASVNEKELEMLLKTTVKVAGGTGPVRADPAWFNWINRPPEEAGAVYGRQLGRGMVADMLNTAILSAVAGLSGESDVQHTDTSGTADFSDFLTGASKFGDQAQQIVCWVVHSKVMFDVYGAALTNTSSLFSFDTINVRQDGFGRVFIVTDSPSLLNADPDPDQYYSVGLVPGGVVVEQNDDFLQNVDTLNGFENIKRTIQSEWTYNLGVKGFSWDKTTGGPSPNNAALASQANWDRIATSHKDLAGVLVTTR